MPIEPKIHPRHLSRYYTVIEPLFTKPEFKAYTMIVLSLFTLSFFGYFAIRPTLSTITNLTKQIKDETLVDQKLQEKINALSEAQVEYEMIKPDLGVVSNALPGEANFPPFIKSLERLATESGTTMTQLSFRNINLSPPEATTSAKEVPVGFTLTVSGEYPNLSDFIKRLATLERLTAIEKVGLSTKKEKDMMVLQMTLTGQAFYVQ